MTVVKALSWTCALIAVAFLVVLLYLIAWMWILLVEFVEVTIFFAMLIESAVRLGIT